MNKKEKNIDALLLKSDNESGAMGSEVNEKQSSDSNNKSSSTGFSSKNESSNISSTDANSGSTNNPSINSFVLKSNKSTSSSDNTNNIASVSKDSTKANENHSLDVIVLNEISEVCQLANCNISLLANLICDNNMKKELVSIYSQYSNMILQINQMFEKYGEIPSCVSLKSKMMGLIGVKTNTMKDKSSSRIADIMLQGTLMGIIKCQKILNSNIEISAETKDLLNRFTEFQRANMQKLNAYL